MLPACSGEHRFGARLGTWPLTPRTPHPTKRPSRARLTHSRPPSRRRRIVAATALALKQAAGAANPAAAPRPAASVSTAARAAERQQKRANCSRCEPISKNVGSSSAPRPSFDSRPRGCRRSRWVHFTLRCATYRSGAELRASVDRTCLEAMWWRV